MIWNFDDEIWKINDRLLDDDESILVFLWATSASTTKHKKLSRSRAKFVGKLLEAEELAYIDIWTFALHAII